MIRIILKYALRYSVGLVLLTLACILPLVTVPASGDIPSRASEELLRITERIVELTNKERLEKGLPALQTLDYLTAAATGHSQEMLELNFFAHESPTPGRTNPKMRIQLARGWDTRVGENIYRAEGVPVNEIAERALAAWRKSPSHYKNLTDPEFNSIGIGVVQKGDRFAVTQNFSKQTIIVQTLEASPSSEGFATVFQGQVRSAGREGALFINNTFVERFLADTNGAFELEFKAPPGAQVSISQKRPGANSYAQNLAFPINAIASEQ